MAVSVENDSYPKRGLILARTVGHITYLSEEAMKQKFGRDLKSGKFMYGFDVEFQVKAICVIRVNSSAVTLMPIPI